MKKTRNETHTPNWQFALILFGVAVMMYGLLMIAASARVLTVQQILVHFVFPSSIGCLIIIVAVVLLAITEDKRRALKK
jgi:hypothetical protein